MTKKQKQLAEIVGILTRSSPNELEPAPPCPRRVQDEISAKFQRSMPAARPPRFFTDGIVRWEFRGGQMTVNGDPSIFSSPQDLLDTIAAAEVDEYGNPLEMSYDEIAAEKGEREQQRESDESI